MTHVPNKGRIPKKHIPIAILIDCSESVEDIRYLLNRSICELQRQLQNRVELRRCVELLVIQFSDVIRIPALFDSVADIKTGQLDIQSCEGTTHTGYAILKALQLLQQQRVIYEGNKEKCSKPLLFLFTDGYPDAGENAPGDAVQQVIEDYNAAAEQIKLLEAEGQLFFCAAGIQRDDGVSADMETLRKLSSKPDERIFQVIGDDNGNETISRFCKMIREAATNLKNKTPLEDALRLMN